MYAQCLLTYKFNCGCVWFEGINAPLCYADTDKNGGERERKKQCSLLCVSIKGVREDTHPGVQQKDEGWGTPGT